MNKIFFLIRKFLDSYRDTLKVVKFYNLKKLNGPFISIKIFFIKFFYSFSFLRNINVYSDFKNNLKYKSKNSEINFDINEFLKDIDNRGYSNYFYVKEESIDKFKNIIVESENHELQKVPLNLKSEINKKKEENLPEYLKRIQFKGITRITGNINLNENNHISRFVLSEENINLAKIYLNSSLISVSCSYFISLPAKNHIEEKEKIANAQFFHWDNDFTKFLKLYVYLTDVDVDSGPHIFVPRTHKKKLLKHSLHRPYSDKDVFNSYADINFFLGKSGSSFFVDSYGLHKGETPKINKRIMLNIHYGKGNIIYNKFDRVVKA